MYYKTSICCLSTQHEGLNTDCLCIQMRSYNVLANCEISHKSSTTFPICNNNPIHFPFMAYHRFRNKSNTAGSTCGAGTDYFPEQLSSPPVFIELCVARSLVFWCSVLYINVCPLVLFCSASFELRLLINPSKIESSIF